MLSKRLIPCLDIRDGRVVKGVSFGSLRDAGDPLILAGQYQRQGADELVILDISATAQGRTACLETITSLREQLSIPLTVGGGVRSVEDVSALLATGADKVATNSAAVSDPDLIDSLARMFGCQCTVLALDAAQAGQSDGWEVVTNAGTRRTGIDALDWACEAQNRGAGEILLTSWDRDGTGKGYDLELIAAVAERVRIPIIASGGARTAQHLLEALSAGADAVLVASVLHFCKSTIPELKTELSAAGIEVRP